MANSRVRLVSLVAAGTLTLTACADGPGDDSATPGPTTPAPSTAGPTTGGPRTAEPVETTEAPADDAETTTAPTELSAEEQDQADIEETLLAFDDALVQALTGQESIEGIYPYSRDTARDQWVTQVMAHDVQGATFSGVTEIEVLETSIEGDTAEAVACRDVSDLEAVDSDGQSIINDQRLDQSLQDFLLERDASAEFGWYVVSDVSRDEPCGD